jgi:hypothetical protein
MKKLLSLFATALALSACDFPDAPLPVFDTSTSVVYIYNGPTAGGYTLSGNIQLFSSYSWNVQNGAPSYIIISSEGSSGTHSLTPILTDALKDHLQNPDVYFTLIAGQGYKIATLTFTAPQYPGGSHRVTIYYRPFMLAFDANGGSGAPEAEIVSPNASKQIFLPQQGSMTPPEPSLYFVGWGTTRDGETGTLYKAGDSYLLQKTTTLYAIWSNAGYSANSPKLIRTQAELAAINTDALSLSLHYKLMENIELTYEGDASWTPIGDSNNSFTGSFDGNGKTISNVKIDGTHLSAGLFGIIRGTEGKIAVQNVVLQNVSINTTGANLFVGAVVGRLLTGILQNCSASGAVSGYGSTTACIGGITGFVSSGSIRQCTANVDVTILNTDVNGSAGGVVGGGENSNILNCAAIGEIHGSWAGGIVGQMSNITIQNCYARGVVEASGSLNPICAGGIAGITSGTNYIINCVALHSKVSAPSRDYCYRIGGFAPSTTSLLKNNYGRTDMEGNTWTNNSNNDGINLDSAGYNDEDWWKNADNWDTTNGFAWNFEEVWEMGTNDLPKLK